MTVKWQILLTKLCSQNNVHGKGHEMPIVKTRERWDTERYKPIISDLKNIQNFYANIDGKLIKDLAGGKEPVAWTL